MTYSMDEELGDTDTEGRIRQASERGALDCRARKRRRLSDPEEDQVAHRSWECSSSKSPTTSTSNPPIAPSSERSRSTSKEINESGTPPAKAKSKYKIHIPKNSELPKDAFFTQPPQRSSSPYRIDQFHWQKPKGQPSPPRRDDQESIATSTSLGPLRERPVPSEFTPRVDKTRDFNRDRKQKQVLDDSEYASQSYEDVLADLPSDAFSSPITPRGGISDTAIPISSQQSDNQDRALQPLYEPRLVAPQTNLRQTTLFGEQAEESTTQSQSVRKHNWPLANREEPATHHKLNHEALKTWVYPTNLGNIREYQYSIVARGLYHNLLVALPTGLGKTFIAATVMLNWFRWTREAQIVFVAPTKPLVSQQVKACFEIAGIPRSTTTMLTGGIAPGLRAEEWLSKRVFFMTPQTIINDLKTGICDPKKLVLLVVDEAHRATGNYAYVEVVKFVSRFNSSFRVLALTATPGASIESVQEVIDGLGISRIEIRTEESIDIRQYVYSRKIDTVLFDNSEEMVMVMDLFSKALQPVLDKLNGMNAYWARDPMTLTPYGCNQARTKWMAEAGKNENWGVKGMVNTIFSLLASLAHGTELLKFHGIGPFFHKVMAFRHESQGGGEKGGKYRKQIIDSEPFRQMMNRVQSWIQNPDFVGHPKLEYLQSVVLNHFLDAGDGRGASDPSSTRIMVFAHYRDSAEEIARVLKRNDPIIRPHVFVGQANSKGSDGMDQRTQLEVIEKFKRGTYNTLVATSIGEEGLDIGEVDLIVCYDASASPIRMLQRMGRTGRKRAGNIVVTLMKGKEENNFIKAKDNYEKMQKEISAGTRFVFHDDRSRRIVPKDIQPIVDKKEIEIPAENSQQDLPEPKRRGKPPKRPPKKFHMPDGVRTGFVKASHVDEARSSDDENGQMNQPSARAPSPTPEPIPPLVEVLLSHSEEREFERSYLDVTGDSPQMIYAPRVDAFPSLQRSLRRTKYIRHGKTTKRTINMLRSMHAITEEVATCYEKHLSHEDRREGIAQAERRATFSRHLIARTDPVPTCSPVSAQAPGAVKKISCRNKENVPRIDVYSSDYEDHDVEFIDDIAENLDAVSSTSSPSPLVNPNKPFYQPSKRSYAVDSDSEEDMPDFSTLVNKSGGTSEKVFFKNRSNVNSSQPNMSRRRKGRRLIVEDDSDDE